MADAFLSLSAGERREALEFAAARSGRPAHLLEKDVWVVWARSTLYRSPLGEHLVFKGGTSLSKAYRIIRRFSEDVDLTYDIRALAPDLVGTATDALPATRSEERRWSDQIRKRLPSWVESTALPIVKTALTTDSAPAHARAEADKIFIAYETAAGRSNYVRPEVMLEFGARSTGEPNTVRDVTCDAAEWLDALTFPIARPRVMRPERSFWEKATAIHVFACSNASAAIASPGTGMTLRVLTMRVSPMPLSRIAHSRTRSLVTRLCSSRRTTRTARGSTIWSQSKEGSALCPTEPHATYLHATMTP